MVQRTIVVLAFVLIARQSNAQQCGAGKADTIPNAGDAVNGMALPWRVRDVREGLREVLHNLKYEILSHVSDSTGYDTKPSYRFPEHPVVQLFRRYKHPGIVVRASVVPEADSSRLFVFARSVCRVDEAPPPGYAVPVESTLELLAAQEIAFGVVEQLRLKHPRRL